MYNYKFNVDYDVNGKDELLKYQNAFLSVMNLKNWDNKQVNKVFDNLIDEIGENNYFKQIFEKKYNYPFISSNDKQTIIPILFSYQSFFYMHKCLQEYFETKKVSEKNMENLDKSLNYLVKK